MGEEGGFSRPSLWGGEREKETTVDYGSPASLSRKGKEIFLYFIRHTVDSEIQKKMTSAEGIAIVEEEEKKKGEKKKRKALDVDSACFQHSGKKGGEVGQNQT